jgi:DNA gyrase/topoisomerase IV subunit B
MPELSTYTGKDIQVLEGLEPVRRRPAMYIGGTGKAGLHHLCWEIVDNAVDEAVNGFASAIEVVLHRDGRSITVSDNGRGIPVDPHPVKKVSALEVILTTLHAGGKFDHANYITSGGLHGVGSSVVNALSEELRVEVKRDGKVHRQTYARGVPTSKLKVMQEGVRGTGTTVFFRPDPEIFETVDFDAALIAENLEIKTYLNAGLKIVFKDEGGGQRHEFHHEGGVAEYLVRLREAEGARPVHPEPFLSQEALEDGGRMEVVLHWTEAPKEQLKSFVNGIPTRFGGTHEQGLKDAVARRLCGTTSRPTTSARRSSSLRPTTSVRGSTASSTCSSWTRSSRARRRSGSTTPRHRGQWPGPCASSSSNG